MPRLDGFGLLAALRAEPATASLPVILLSARADDAARIAGLEAGATDYLAKPFSARELLARVAGTIAVGRVRRQALQRERELRAETVGVLESMTDAFIAVDPQWCITYVNARAEQLLGMARAQLVGRNHWTLFPEAIGTPAEHEIRRAMAERVSVQVERDVARDGGWFEISAFPIRRGGLAVFGRDITARRMAQTALLRADRRKDEFLATLAHELRNPLAPIRSALQLLRRPGSTLDAEPLYAMMERQVDHIVRLVDDLLEVARITEGKIELRRAPLDLADVIGRAVETCRTQIEAAGHVLVLDLPPTPLPVHADAVRLSQVFANLLNNAAKYTESGGRIEVGARLDGDTIVATVSDNGVGIRGEMLPHVFDLFTQADDAGRHSQGGLGIGLTLVRSLVEMHGGTVEAHSEGMMAGSRFVVRLERMPVPADSAPASSAVAAEPAPPLSPAAPARRVLVVDDNADAAEGVALVLQFLGVQTHVVNDGAAALAALDGFRPHLVLLDLGMPGLDGYDVARWMRQRESHAGTRIVALTGWGDGAERARTLEAGFDAHLVKPVDIAALQALLGL
jgi:PAS domain S-box-containing protein